MKLQYFEDTDTLYLELQNCETSETWDLDENTLLYLDCEQNICAINFEHASKRMDLNCVQVEGIGQKEFKTKGFLKN